MVLNFDCVTGLKKFLKKNATGDTLAVLDAKLGNIIKEKLEIPCIFRFLTSAATTATPASASPVVGLTVSVATQQWRHGDDSWYQKPASGFDQVRPARKWIVNMQSSVLCCTRQMQ